MISKALIDSNNIHNEFVLIKNAPKDFDDMKEEIKSSNNKLKLKPKKMQKLKIQKL